MGMKKMALVSLFAVVLGGAATASASSVPAERCGIDKYSVFSVSPFSSEENYGLGGYTVLKGAQFYVTAKQGLTAEWVNLVVSHELERLQASADPVCRPNVKNVQVQVTSAGPGFWVFLSANDESSAKRLLSWAKTIATKTVVQ